MYIYSSYPQQSSKHQTMSSIPSSPSFHALDLPEIVFGIAQYLDAADVLACSAVSKSFYCSFAPFVWQDLHFGQPCIINSDNAPFARHIHIHRDTEQTYLQRQPQLQPKSQQPRRRGFEATSPSQFLSTIQNITPWVRSLSIHSHDSILPMKLGESCTRLESFTIQGHSLLSTTEYWETCKKVIIQNQSHLRSLSMINWMSQYRGSPAMPHVVWSPIRECAQAFNLRTLKLENSYIGLKDLPAFWSICERLEELTLDSANFDLSMLPSVVAQREMIKQELESFLSLPPSPPLSPIRSSPPYTGVTSSGDVDSVGHVLFPRLRKLCLRGMNWVQPIHQLHLLIQPCPVLQTLYWQIDKRKRCPSSEFVELFLASTWPDLDSITITDQCKPLFTSDQYHQILQASSSPSPSAPFITTTAATTVPAGATLLPSERRLYQRNRRSMRRLDVKTADGILPSTFELLRNLHFETIQKIDLIYCEGNTSQWSIQILTSCPGLESFRAKGIKAQEILQASQQRPWACRGLKELTVFIDMGFQNNGPNRRFTPEELVQCRSIFRLLADLRELHTLDMLTSYAYACDPCNLNYHRDPHHPRHLLVPLPIRLKAGLDLMQNSTKLEKVWFWGGRQYLPKRELSWMVLNWKRLKNLAGGGRIRLGAPKSLEDKYIWAKPLQNWLNELGISTLGTRYEQYAENMSIPEKYEDCCGASDSDDEEGREKEAEKEAANAQ